MSLTRALVIVINKFGTHLWDLSVAHMRTKNMAIVRSAYALGILH